MTDLDLSELERLEAKATAGLDLDSLSKLIESPNQHYTGIFPLKGQEWPAVLLGNYYVAFTQRPEEAVRLMRILNAFPALLAHIRRIEREASEARGERDEALSRVKELKKVKKMQISHANHLAEKLVDAHELRSDADQALAAIGAMLREGERRIALLASINERDNTGFFCSESEYVGGHYENMPALLALIGEIQALAGADHG